MFIKNNYNKNDLYKIKISLRFNSYKKNVKPTRWNDPRPRRVQRGL